MARLHRISMGLHLLICCGYKFYMGIFYGFSSKAHLNNKINWMILIKKVGLKFIFAIRKNEIFHFFFCYGQILETWCLTFIQKPVQKMDFEDLKTIFLQIRRIPKFMYVIHIVKVPTAAFASDSESDKSITNYSAVHFPSLPIRRVWSPSMIDAPGGRPTALLANVLPSFFRYILILHDTDNYAAVDTFKVWTAV
jgi:hypothetical protein